MDKKVIALIALFMVFIGFQAAAPAAAAKVVDHGTKITYNNDMGWLKIVWKTYQYNINHLKVNVKYYNIHHGKPVFIENDVSTLTKVSKSKIKITINVHSTGINGDPGINYRKTKLTASQYYWRVFRHEM